MGQKIRTDTPSFSEWSGKWRRSVTVPRLTEAAFEKHEEALHKWLKLRYEVWEFGKVGDCYVRGDNLVDRTEQVCITNSKILTPELLKYIQKFLRSGWPDWRIMIAIGAPEEHIMIYPDVIRINPAAEADLEGFCEKIRPQLETQLKEGLAGWLRDSEVTDDQRS